MTIDVICLNCGCGMAAHTFGGCSRCDCRSSGFILLDSHALDDVPPAMRALHRARLAQAEHDRRIDVQLPLSRDGAFE